MENCVIIIKIMIIYIVNNNIIYNVNIILQCKVLNWKLYSKNYSILYIIFVKYIIHI